MATTSKTEQPSYSSSNPGHANINTEMNIDAQPAGPLQGAALDKTYRYWRIRTMYAIYIGYAAFYITRKSVTYAAPELMANLSLTTAQIGLLGTITYIAYGVSKFISGALSDRSNPRYFMSLGLFATAIANLLFGFSSNFTFFCWLWVINGFFQGWGWPPCSRLLTHWYARRERGLWWGIWNSSHNMGGALAPLVAIGCIKYFANSRIVINLNSVRRFIPESLIGWLGLDPVVRDLATTSLGGGIETRLGAWLRSSLGAQLADSGVYYWVLDSWRLVMLISAVVAVLISIFLFNRLRDVPESQGLPPIEEYKHEASGEEIERQLKESAHLTVWQNFMRYILKNRYIWLLAFAYVAVYVVRTAFNDWGTIYFSQHGLTNEQARQCMAMFEIGGFAGGLLAGWFSDRFFQGMRGQINFLFCLGVLAVTVILILFNISHYHFPLAVLLSTGVGFFIFGPQMMIGVTAAELSHRESAGVSTGFVGLFGYLGAALSGYPIGCIIKCYGWQGFLITLVACAVLSTLLLMPLIHVKQRQG